MTSVPAAAGTIVGGRSTVSQKTGVMRRTPFGTNPSVGERGSGTQRRILASGLAVFAEVGFHDARVELITKRAGCSRPAFYQYFSSKDEVFWTLAGHLGREMVTLGERLGKVGPDAEGVAALTEWIDAFATLHETYAAVFSAFPAASRDDPKAARASSAVSDRLDGALLAAFGVDARSKKNANLAMGVVAVLIRCSFYSEAMGDVDRSRLVRALAEMTHRLFAGPIDGVNVMRRSGRRRSTGPLPPAPVAEHLRELPARGTKTRQRLLDAGAAVLPARGYHATRVDDIAEHAGVSHGSFYRYFENKDDFFRVMAEAASTSMIELLDRFPRRGDPAPLGQWLEDWFATYAQNGGVISTWQEVQSADASLASYSMEVAAAVVARLVNVLDDRDFGDPSVDALALLALTERMPYAVFTLRFLQRADATGAMATIIRRGFLGLAD